MKIPKFDNRTLTEKKYDVISKRYVELYAEGWREDVILNKLSEEFFINPITIMNKISRRPLRLQAKDIIRAKYKAIKNGTYIETQTQPMNGVEFR